MKNFIKFFCIATIIATIICAICALYWVIICGYGWREIAFTTALWTAICAFVGYIMLDAIREVCND